jgi:glucose/arabinose dehydrogenase
MFTSWFVRHPLRVLLAGALLAACSDTSEAEADTDDPPTTAMEEPGIDGGDSDGASASDAAPRLRLGDPIADMPDAVDLRVRPGTDQIYVADRVGVIHRLGSTPAVDLSDSFEPSLEQGLLGMAFSPDGDALYLNTVTAEMTRIVEYQVDPDGAIDPTSERLVLEFAQPYEGHNGGDLFFDDSGNLLILSGDGGFVGDPDRTAQDLRSPLGKVLRIDPTPDEDREFQIPGDNPFIDEDGFGPLVWSYGLRNPWRGKWDPLTGDLWIGDVGEFTWEEINVGWAEDGSGRGANFGWSGFDGPDRYNEDQVVTNHTPPFHAYEHDGQRCSITGGKVYRGSAIGDLAGWYVFSDFCDGVVRAMEIGDDQTPGREVVADGQIPNPVAIRSGPDGELYIVSILGPIVPLEAVD